MIRTPFLVLPLLLVLTADRDVREEVLDLVVPLCPAFRLAEEPLDGAERLLVGQLWPLGPADVLAAVDAPADVRGVAEHLEDVDAVPSFAGLAGGVGLLVDPFGDGVQGCSTGRAGECFGDALLRFC